MRTPPWLPVAACLVAVAPALAQPAAPEPEPAAPGPGAADASATGPLASGLGLKWRLAPIATSGMLSYDFRATRGAGEGRTTSHLVTANISARTYVWQPWFATLSGNVAFTSSRFRSGPINDPLNAFSAQERLTSNEQFLTGKLRADVFPQSRFPFEVHAERTDSRIDSGLASPIDFRSQNLGFSQRYRPESGAYDVRAAYDRREQFALGSRDVQDALAGDLSTRWRNNTLSLGLAFNQARRQPTDERSEFRSLVARHRYIPGSELSVDTTVNWSRARDDLIGARSDLGILQWSSIGLMHRTGSKLTLTGSVRGLALRDEAGGSQFDSFGGTLGANYQFNRNLLAAASIGASTSRGNQSHSQGLTGSGALSWQADPIDFAGARYERFASGGASFSQANATTLAPGADAVGRRTLQTSENGQVGHSLNRSWRVGPVSSVMLDAAQTFSATHTRAPADLGDIGSTGTRMLLHTLGATWNVSGDNRSAFARATASDSTELGGTRARFRLLNFQLSGNFQIDRNRSLTGDLTLQRATHSGGGLLPSVGGPLFVGSGTSSSSARGEVNYRELRFLGQPRLRFISRLRLARDVLREAGTLASIPDRETRLWENRLEWSIGRLETQLLLRISEIDGRRQDLLMFRIQRNFGD